MRHYFLKPIRPRQTVAAPVLSVSPASLSLDRTSPGNVATFTASLSPDPGSPLAVTVSSSDPSVTVSPAVFSLGGGNPVTATVTVTGAAAGPDSASLSVSAPGQTTKSIAIVRPPVPLDLTVSPASLVLDRVSPGNAGSFTVALNRVPDSAVAVSVSSSDTSVAVSPASFSLSTGNPPSRSVALTGAATGPSPVTISVVPVGLSTRTVSVTRTPFTPAVLSGLALWLDGGDAASVTLDGSNNVSQWSDKSGNARHVTQASATQRPAYVASAINGLNCLNFDGSDDFLASSAFTLGELTLFAVVTARWTVTETGAFFGQNFTANKSFGRVGGAGFDYLANDIRCVTDGFNSGTSGPRAIGPQPAGLINGQAVLITTRLGTTGTVLRVNRASIARVARNDPPTSINLPVAVGRPGSSYPAEYWNGRIAELVLYNRLVSDTERDQVESYLAARWGTP